MSVGGAFVVRANGISANNANKHWVMPNVLSTHCQIRMQFSV